MASVILEAAMRLDNKHFMDAVKQSTREIKNVKAETALFRKQLSGASQASLGISAILSGNRVQGAQAL